MERHGHKDLKVYRLAYRLAMQVFELSRSFLVEERYSLTDQARRSSRSVCANLAEGFRKRQYPNHFVSKLSDADSEATETQVWLDFALDCGYMSSDHHDELIEQYGEVGKMIGSMIAHPERFSTAEGRKQ